MATIKPTYASVELTKGGESEPTFYDDVRVIFADRLAYEKTAKARGWKIDQQPMTGSGFLAWAALHRTGQYAGSYDDFLAEVVDVQLDDEKAGELEVAGPTLPAH